MSELNGMRVFASSGERYATQTDSDEPGLLDTTFAAELSGFGAPLLVGNSRRSRGDRKPGDWRLSGKDPGAFDPGSSRLSGVSSKNCSFIGPVAADRLIVTGTEW